ncbi:MAG: hypothetical protein ACYC5M_14385 [Anaerolineae bacterium]
MSSDRGVGPSIRAPSLPLAATLAIVYNQAETGGDDGHIDKRC